jgi:hypothetical protein
VYVTLVDDQRLDCIIRQGPDCFFDVQIKARSKESKAGKVGHCPLLDCTNAKRTIYTSSSPKALASAGGIG